MLPSRRRAAPARAVLGRRFELRAHGCAAAWSGGQSDSGMLRCGIGLYASATFRHRRLSRPVKRLPLPDHSPATGTSASRLYVQVALISSSVLQDRISCEKGISREERRFARASLRVGHSPSGGRHARNAVMFRSSDLLRVTSCWVVPLRQPGAAGVGHFLF